MKELVLPSLLIFGVGFLSSFINIVAGGGSVLTLGSMLLLNMDATIANGTNRLGLLAGGISGTFAYKKHYKKGVLLHEYVDDKLYNNGTYYKLINLLYYNNDTGKLLNGYSVGLKLLFIKFLLSEPNIYTPLCLSNKIFSMHFCRYIENKNCKEDGA